MTEKQYKVVADDLGEYSVLRGDNSIVITEIQHKVTAEVFCDELNELSDENDELKEIINECFNSIITSDFAKNEYCSALLRILGEENDVDKAKQRIKEFLE